MITDLALDIDLLSDAPLAQKADNLFLLSREALRRRMLDELWKAKAATSPRSLVGVLTSEPVLDGVRKELRRRTGHNCEAGKLSTILRDEVIKPGIG